MASRFKQAAGCLFLFARLLVGYRRRHWARRSSVRQVANRTQNQSAANPEIDDDHQRRRVSPSRVWWASPT
jgi:hypothetical protein